MSNNRITVGISKGLPQEKDRAIKIIVAFTGENPNKLSKLSMDELVQYLGFIMQCEKEKIEELLREHDQNQELDEVSIKALWKLVSKGTIKAQEKDFGTMPKKSYEQLKFLMSGLMRMAMIRAENMLGSQTSTVTVQDLKRITNINPKQPIISLDDIKKTHAFKVMMNNRTDHGLNKVN
ncbi:MAG: hypothetical protein ACK5AV_00805 [Alphaproteobacteria bacterium]|jgi:hypothetical protein